MDKFTIVAWGSERPSMTFTANSAVEAYELALDKAVYAALEVRIRNERGEMLTLEELRRLAQHEAGG